MAASVLSARVLVFRKPPMGKGNILILGTHSPPLTQAPLTGQPFRKEKHCGDNVQRRFVLKSDFPPNMVVSQMLAGGGYTLKQYLSLYHPSQLEIHYP